MRKRLVVTFSGYYAELDMEKYLNEHPNMKLIGFAAVSITYYVAVFEDESERNV